MTYNDGYIAGLKAAGDALTNAIEKTLMSVEVQSIRDHTWSEIERLIKSAKKEKEAAAHNEIAHYHCYACRYLLSQESSGIL